jgi:hypothetical protein
MQGVLKSSVEVAGVVFLLLFTTLNANNQAAIDDVKPIETSETEQEEIHYLNEKELSLLYTCKDEPINDTCMVIDQEDAERLKKIAVVEDFSDAESQAYIMAVILNRVESPLFPDTVQEVIAQKNPVQFATYYNGNFDKAEPDGNSGTALGLIESGQIDTDALYFEASTKKNTWMKKHLTYVGTFGGTDFYK